MPLAESFDVMYDSMLLNRRFRLDCDSVQHLPSDYARLLMFMVLQMNSVMQIVC